MKSKTAEPDEMRMPADKFDDMMRRALSVPNPQPSPKKKPKNKAKSAKATV